MERVDAFRDMHWLMDYARRPFMTDGDGNLPELRPSPLWEDSPHEDEEEIFDRLVSRVIPKGSDVIDGRRVYGFTVEQMRSGNTVLFMRDPREWGLDE